MAIQSITVKFTGISPLLQNNPQTVDPFNSYAKAKKPLTSKRSKTDEDLYSIRKIEVESKVFLDDEIGVYVPSRWVLAAIAKNSYAIAKVSKEKARGSIFTVSDKCKLSYDGIELVKTKEDISCNEKFVTVLILPQKQVRLAKSFPIFHKWSFECELEFDDTVIDETDLVRVLKQSAKYGGFGDFRPTYGRALCEVI